MKETRTQKIAALLKLLERGPHLFDVGAEPFTPKVAEERVRIWLGTWIRPLVEDLVPELRREQSTYRKRST